MVSQYAETPLFLMDNVFTDEKNCASTLTTFFARVFCEMKDFTEKNTKILSSDKRALYVLWFYFMFSLCLLYI